MTPFSKSALVAAMHAALFGATLGFSPALLAQESDKNLETEEKQLETITITAQRRSQSIQEVPISVATLSGEKFDSIFSSGDDITALAIKVPGLYAESSNGRAAPRFYIRGLGNTDFDLAASQPVSIVMDDVVMENVILKSFPLFDVEQVEVIRGPQGTLFGRNTTAGIIKFDTVKPRQEFDAYVKTTAGTLGSAHFEGAVGGGLTDSLSARLSLLSQHRSNWIDNSFTGQNDVMGGYDERAARLQFLFESDAFDALLNVHNRNYDGTSTMFRKNILTQGSNELNNNYDRDVVAYDGPGNNRQNYDAWGTSLKVDVKLEEMTLTSITALEKASGGGIGDIDGGNVNEAGDAAVADAVTEDQLNGLRQFTQEFRLASDTSNALSWQVGTYYFDSSFAVNTVDGFFGATEVFHGNTSWALFGQATYQLTEKLTVTGGLRYTDDEKTFSVGQQNVDGFAVVLGIASEQQYDPIKVKDDQLGWELSANYRLTDTTSLFTRAAEGFRAQTIQGRDVAFEAPPSVAGAETITSFEVGTKSDLLDNTLRLNAALFYYVIDDIQLSAIGGETQGNQLINADKGTGYGFEVDFDYRVLKNLMLGGGFSYNKTELKDDNLTIAPCGSGQCTVLDPVVNGLALINGNPFPQAPETILTLNARYDYPLESGEIYVYADYQVQGDTNLFLYESAEFNSKNNNEAGLRVAYVNYKNSYEVGVFGRNITDQDNLKGAIDFSNLTGFVNEPRVFGIDFRMNFY
ncbi:TonB-dependent receptor [Alishewanella sp. SMS8]|uniref:TonB-dependent receptor n=1 Tax=Alishewanella sp. SMS8 TaxID=2994676 RepID=UPI0027422694|nr:TonB-dependent receptor [Alishewanella sp. SMS8]MDP4945767.1 TonB-dependent receptor [Alishewanella sp.]MDP5035173.1 TonB-dependent receptor [Alishewanella sp.]MDP5186448.1 TonB-dependent receptor [Alishewanella sp.]MDP5460618.1 TonB-dependent receptor [Alishewanella sp. SMS8]